MSEYGGQERRATTLDGLESQVRCTVKSFLDFRRQDFIPLRNDVTKLHACVDEVLDVVKFLKTGFKVTSWITATAAAGAVFGRTMGWW